MTSAAAPESVPEWPWPAEHPAPESARSPPPRCNGHRAHDRFRFKTVVTILWDAHRNGLTWFAKSLSKQESLELGFAMRQSGEILQTGR